MRIKFILTSILLLALVVPTIGQNYYKNQMKRQVVVPKEQAKENKLKDEPRSLWFISLGSGVQTIMAEDDSKASFGSRITYAPSITVGKYFSNTLGVRFNLTGGSLHGFNDGISGTYRKWNTNESYMGKGYAGTTDYPSTVGSHFTTWDPTWNGRGFKEGAGADDIEFKDGQYVWRPGTRGELYMQHIRYTSVNMNVMVDALSLFGDKNPQKPFELTTFFGPSYFHVFANNEQVAYNGFGINGGLQAKIRLSNKVDLFFEGSVSRYPNDFDGHAGQGTSCDVVAQAITGLTFKIGQEKKPVVLVEQPPINMEQLREVNKQVNDLKAKLAELENKKCPECPELVKELRKDINDVKLTSPKLGLSAEKELVPVKGEPTYLPEPVFFRIDKSVIDETEWQRIELAVDYLNKNTHAKVVVTGYADKKTGTVKRNLVLSKERAIAVANALEKKYKIDKSRISISWKGDEVQPFIEKNEWNRVVIFVIE